MLSLRLSSEDERLIRNYARYNQLTVSEFLRMAALERIENEYFCVWRHWSALKMNTIFRP